MLRQGSKKTTAFLVRKRHDVFVEDAAEGVSDFIYLGSCRKRSLQDDMYSLCLMTKAVKHYKHCIFYFISINLYVYKVLPC